MITQIVLATKNLHKIKEIKYFLEPLGINITSLDELNIDLPNGIEIHPTYQENAKAKCIYISQYTHIPILADDSGLEIPILQNKPGIFSARYAGTGSEKDNRKKILQEMAEFKRQQRNGHFICILCLLYNQEYYYFKGISQGLILEQEQGNCGFGYDSIFECRRFRKSYAELSFLEKLSVSHRGKALKKMAEWISK